MSHDAFMARGKQRCTATITEEVGKHLRWAWEVIAESQADMCRRLGDLDTSTWNRWERGNRYPDPVVMVELCESFGFYINHLHRGRFSGVKEDVAFRLAAHHPGLVNGAAPAATRRVEEGGRAA